MTIKKQPIELDDDVLKDLDLSHHFTSARPAVKQNIEMATTADAEAEPIEFIGPAEGAIPGSSAYVEPPNFIDGFDDFDHIRWPVVELESSGAEKTIFRAHDELAGIVSAEVPSLEVDDAIDEREPEIEIEVEVEVEQKVEIVDEVNEGNVVIFSEDPSLPPTPISGLPDGFSARADGIYVVVKPEKPDGEYNEEFLCSPLQVINLFRQRNGLGWGRSIVVTNPEGGETTIPVLSEVIESQGRAVFAQLSGRGLRFGKVKRAREIVLELLKDWSPDKMMLSTNRLGWSDEACEAFVLGHDRIFGDTNVVSVSSEVSSFAHGLSAAGTNDDWKAEIAAKCVGNALLTTVVSLAFVGPLLELLGRDGGGLLLRSKSSRGKTTLQRVAASVWGSPELVKSWRTTANALETTAASANSTLLVLDELGEVKGRNLFDAAYMLANGVGKARMGGFGRQSHTQRWKLPILSSGEISIAEKIAEGGQRIKAGQEVRLIDVVADAGLYCAFDDLHGCLDGAEFSKLLKEKCGAVYGTAGPAFVEWLLRNKTKVEADVQRIEQLFLAKTAEQHKLTGDGVTIRAAKWFALIAAAGELATEAGLTGWVPIDTITTVAGVYGVWLDARAPEDSVAATTSVSRVRTYLLANAERFVVIAKTGPAEASEYGWQDDGCFLIPGAIWKTIHNGVDMKIAAKGIDEAGFLMPGEDENWMRKAPTAIQGRPRVYFVRKSIMNDGKDLPSAA